VSVAVGLTVLVLTMALLFAWWLRPRYEPLTWYELRLPSDVPAAALVGLLRVVAGVWQGPVVFITVGEPGVIRFFLGAPKRVSGSVLGSLRGLLPELQAEPADERDAIGLGDGQRGGVRVSWRGPWPLLRTREPEISAGGLLGAIGSAREGERVRLITRLWPARRVNRPVPASERGRSANRPWWISWLWPAEPPREEVSVIRAKFSGLLLRAELLVASEAAGSERVMQLNQRVVAALRAGGGVRGVLAWSRISTRRLGKLLSRQRRPMAWERSMLLSPEELVGFIGLPAGSPAVPGVSYGAAPRLFTPNSVPVIGRVFAASTSPSQSGRLIAQGVKGGLQHTAIIGGTGSGKSTLAARLIEADMRAGRGALVIDLKGDLIETCLSLLPKERKRDAIVMEPARDGLQPGLRLFPPGGDEELTADLLLSTLKELFAESWGVRSSQYLALGLRTAARLPGGTLADLPAIFAERRLRNRALEVKRDPWLSAAWQRFDALTPSDQAAQIAAPLTKLEELVGRKRVRVVLNQREPKLDFRQVLASGKLVFVSLPPGLMGQPATRLIASMVLWQFFQAVEGRAALPAAARKPYMAYIDEVAAVSSLPLPLSGLFERARSHGCGLTLMPQALSQLSPEVRTSLLANVGSLVAFKQLSDEEATALARALPGVTPVQLQHLGPYEIALRLSLGPGEVTPVMTGKTLPPLTTCSDPDEIRKLSAEHYGGLSDEAAETARHEAPSGPLGVIRRQS
jgi:hypothetical protein